MNWKANKSLHWPLLAAGIAAILVSGIAVGSLAISARGNSGVLTPIESRDEAAEPPVSVRTARSYRCPECGVIESTREIEAPDTKAGASAPGRIVVGSRGDIEGKPVRISEIVIRLQDGSMHQITDANPARWRRGDRVKIIAGVNR